jgi:ABC-type multidrug transport system fused ATPase/permease subunit
MSLIYRISANFGLWQHQLIIFCGVPFPPLRGVNQAATNFYDFEQGRIAAHRLFSVINSSPQIDKNEGKDLVNVQGNVEFRNVYFSYPYLPDEPVLNGFFLNIPARKTVALVGREDSGKRGIIPLLQRFYDPSLGKYSLHILKYPPLDCHVNKDVIYQVKLCWMVRMLRI